jgi:predicted HicB family RNase H-like nuclease
MNTMSHKGYTARIEFDDRDNIFVGRVLGLSAMISFHGETVKELRSEFKNAIEAFWKNLATRATRSSWRSTGCSASGREELESVGD